MKKLVSLPLLVLCAASVAGSASAGDPAAKSADQQKMMEMWQALAVPSAAHKQLETMVGTWDTKVTSWMEPGAPPMESSGTSENRMVLGGRWLEQRFEGSFMDSPFHGIGYTGYDNYKKQYVGTWMDTMSTCMMNTTGTADAAGKTMTFMGSMDDPMTGGTCQMKEVVTIVDKDHHKFEMWTTAPDGQMYKNMEISYSRKM
jgi:hypothetical protein